MRLIGLPSRWNASSRPAERRPRRPSPQCSTPAACGVAVVPASGNLSVLRALRILRLLRVISAAPRLRRVVEGFISALPGMGSVFLLMGLIFYIGAVMATKMFGGECAPCSPEEAVQFQEWFGSIGLSAYTLFQIMTLESWSMGVVRPTMELFPYAWVFFVPFIIVTSFAVLNLFIGIVVNAMQTEHEKAAAEEREAEREMIHEETAPLVDEVRALRAEIAALRQRIETSAPDEAV